MAQFIYSAPMDEYPYPNWQPALMAVMAGAGKTEHIQRVRTAQLLIHRRLYEIAGVKGNDVERSALQEAWETLRVLKSPQLPD